MNIEQDPDNDEYYRLTENGVENAIKAYEMFKEGLSHNEISDKLELSKPDDTEEEKTQFVQILIAMADMTGVLDKWEEFKEMDSALEEVAEKFEE